MNKQPSVGNEELDTFLSDLGVLEQPPPPQAAEPRPKAGRLKHFLPLASALSFLLGVLLGFCAAMPLTLVKERAALASAVEELKETIRPTRELHEETLLDELTPPCPDSEIIEPLLELSANKSVA